MLASIVFAPVMGLPMIAWGGLVTFLLLVVVALGGSSIISGKPFLSVKTHKILAWLGLIMAAFHGLAGLLAFLGV